MATEDLVTPLKDEHKRIVRQIGLVGMSLRTPTSGQRKALRKAISELGSRLQTHFAHEERTLYATLNARLNEHTPTEELLGDHEAIQAAFAALDRMGAEGAPAAELRGQLSSLRSALNGHMEKEEKVVFWLAESHL